MTYRNQAYRAALGHLVDLINQGVEFPDAAWKAASRYGVNQHALERAYDQFCAAR